MWFIAGVASGALLSQAIAHPRGRALAKSLLKRSMSVKDFLMSHIELAREDLSDLVAEARAERDDGRTDDISLLSA